MQRAMTQARSKFPSDAASETAPGTVSLAPGSAGGTAVPQICALSTQQQHIGVNLCMRRQRTLWRLRCLAMRRDLLNEASPLNMNGKSSVISGKRATGRGWGNRWKHVPRR